MSFINPIVQPGERDGVLATQALIRMSMVIGVLLFGAVVWFLRRNDAGPYASSDFPLAAIMPFALGAGLVGAFVMRSVVGHAVSPAERFSRLLIGWAIGEAVALLGGVHYFMTGDPKWFLGGLFAFLIALVLLPLRRD